MKNHLIFLLFLFCSASFGQNSITGSVVNSNNEAVLGANVGIKGDPSGTITDSEGKFVLKSSKKLPWSVQISCVGYESQSVMVSSNKQNINIVLKAEQTKLNEVVISASRAPERIFESPVTVERMSLREIKKTASPSFYDGIENMKEVHMNTSSLTFKSINTRGFATVANERFLQLVDGMDNSSPLLNFVLGNMIGVSEIDIQNVELLPGASSALYGANAFNGVMFMNSKSPFIYQGISTYFKYGQTSQEAAGTNGFYDFGIRMAHAFDKHFAAKFNFTHLEGTDWYATNYNDYKNGVVTGQTRTNPGYNGLNVYGDEFTQNLASLAPTLVSSIPSLNTAVSRTGYNEVDLTDNKAGNTKVDFSLHFRPLGDESLEVIWLSKFGLGNAVYQGGNRYYLNNFFMQQHKLEIKGKNFFVRGYTTTEDGGESYDMTFTAWNINNAWKSNKQWYTDYLTNYVGAYSGGVTGITPGNVSASHAFARTQADVGRLIPGTAAFQSAFDKVIAEPDAVKGSKLVDNSKIYHSDVNYNFRDVIKFAEFQVGGSYRQYLLNSHGRIYTDANSGIDYSEYGLYTQVQKKLLDDRLKFTGSIRYDKSENFEGNYSPRVSVVYAVGEEKVHNLRVSYQTGFRNPGTQDQYIGFNIGPLLLLGSAPDNLLRYSETLPVSTAGQFYTGAATVKVNGENAYYNSYTRTSVEAFAAFAAANPTNLPGAAALLKKTNVGLVKPEQVKAIELGYRSQIQKVYVDVNGYFNVYNDFIGRATALAPLYGKASESFNFVTGAPTYTTNPEVQSLVAIRNADYRAYQLYTNTPLEIRSYGVGIGLSKKFFGNYDIGVSYNYAEFEFDQSQDPSFQAGFNTPKNRVKASIGNDKLFENFGFNLSGRWNSEYLWESSFATGMVASATVIDAQVNYSFPSIKSVLKIGAANLGGKEYTQVLGAGAIGRQIFASFTIKP
ncbi:TonB-dependent receptor [Flavobacterium sp. NG2]|uniref:TonB-dependent receptor domain-containing protein n=1 Tax=Flavobacterium sp. NG2 TaxID=3097547 RepID=UPI002A802931|nr:TonB-dependent receptor [Flavobacterium sp. NG2]WPR72107.1 TonB-dependent receptor [Flavobacterium sp. NG2]